MKRIFVISIIMLVLGTLILAACPTSPTTPTTTAPTTTAPTTTPPSKPVPEEIVIGDIVSSSGPLASWGLEVAFGSRAAFEDINKLGGIFVEEYNTRIPVRWVTRDGQSDPLKVQALAEDLVNNEKIDFFGPHMEMPEMREGLAMVAEKYKIPAVVGIGPQETWMAIQAATKQYQYTWTYGLRIGTPFPEGDPRANNPGFLFFPTLLGAIQEFSAQTNQKVAMFARDDIDSRTFYRQITGPLQEMGFECYKVDKEFGIYPPGSTDFTSLIQEWKKADCQVFIGSGYAPDFGTFLRQAKALEYNPPVVFALKGAINYIEAAGSWGEELADGVLCEIYWDPSIKNGVGIGDTTPQSLIERWDLEYTTPVNKAIGWDYTGSQILFGAIERAGTLDREAVLQAISETWGMPSMFGPIYIDKETQRHDHESQIGQWQLTESGWQQPIVFSYNENMSPTAEMKLRD